MQTVRIMCKIEGISPLLMNRFSDEEQMQASNATRSSSAAGDRGTPLQQATTRLYTDENGLIIMPQPCLNGSIMEGGKFFRAGRSKITTQRSSLIPACMQITELYYPLQYKDAWAVDSRPVRMPTTGGRILRHRPCFYDWGVEFDMELDTSEMSARFLRQIVDAAGKKVGLCDYRPACRGPFGRYVVTKWRVDDLDMLEEDADDETAQALLQTYEDETAEEDDEIYAEMEDEDEDEVEEEPPIVRKRGRPRRNAKA